MLDKLSAADFETLPDRRIELAFGDRRVTLEVTEVRALAPTKARAITPFTVTLRENGANQSMPQATYAYRHPQHGTLELFTVPLGPDGKGMCYEIIFN
jgi:hypothetical protein